MRRAVHVRQDLRRLGAHNPHTQLPHNDARLPRHRRTRQGEACARAFSGAFREDADDFTRREARDSELDLFGRGDANKNIPMDTPACVRSSVCQRSTSMRWVGGSGVSTANCVFPGRAPRLHESGCVLSPAPAPLCTQRTIVNETTCAARKAPHGDGPNPRAPDQVWNGGNWGFLVSRGAMARITPAQWLDCVECKNDFHGCYGGGDCRLGECLWRYGIAPTLPDRDYTDEKAEQRLGGANADEFIVYLQAHKSSCDEACQQRLKRPLSINPLRGEGVPRSLM